MVKAILYDLDGVLVEACEIHYEALNDALFEIAHYRISREDHLTTYNGLPTNRKLDMLTQQGLIQSTDHERVWLRKQSLTFNAINRLLTLDQVKIDLHHFTADNKIKSACVTNSIRESAELMLRRTGQIDFMEFIISNEDVSKQKPHPEPYLKAMERLGFELDAYLLVEDSDKGYQSAIATGAKVLRVRGPDEVNVETISKWL